MNDFWMIKKVNGESIPVPKNHVYCWICGNRLVLHNFSTKINVIGNKKFYHADIHMKCPSCGWFVTFGVPLSKEEYDLLSKSKYNNVVLTFEILDFFNINDEEIKKRLELWGYW